MKSEELEKYREEIDKINNEILELIRKRKDISRKIGEYKKKFNLPVIDEKREQEIYKKLEKQAEEKGLDKELVIKTFRLIINNSREIQK